MKTDIWMPLYIGDYLADTIGLSDEQHGRYLLAIMAYWKKRGPLPDIEAKSILKSDAKQLERFFRVSDGFWRHERIDKELSQADKHQRDILDNSRKGVEARRRSGDLPATTKGEPKVDQGTYQRRTPSPSPSVQKEIDRENHPNLPEIPPMSRRDFDALVAARGIDQSCAEWFWNDMDSKNWVDKDGRVIRKVEPKLVNCANAWRANHRQNGHTETQYHEKSIPPDGVESVPPEMRRRDEQDESARANASWGRPFAQSWYDDENKLRKEWDESKEGKKWYGSALYRKWSSNGGNQRSVAGVGK